MSTESALGPFAERKTMRGETMNEKDFVSYEYATKSVQTNDRTRATDLYEAFGWEISSSVPSLGGSVTLSLRRDRKQRHRQELNRLERQAEELLSAIGRQKRAQTLGASIFSYLFGCIAALVLGGGMCLCLLVENSVPALVGGIFLGLIGIVLCGVNYLIYRRLAEKKTKQLLPLIDENEEKLADLLEKGNDLLRADLI